MDNDDLVESEDQFWDELDDIVSTPCRTSERIDDTLRTWIGFIGVNKDAFVQTEDDVRRVSVALLSSSLFSKNEDYIRRQITFALLQEDDPLSLHLAAATLLLDGSENESTFALMNGEGAFAHLVALVRDAVDDSRGLNQRLMELLYEMSRIQQITPNQLTSVDDDFVVYLFQIIEGLTDRPDDPYHYPVIRVLLVLNEQYMIASQDPNVNSAVTNRVMKAFSMHGHSYKTFGENLILLLNRESETSLQFLILKLLWLLFTTASTQEYFYTNDLYVLIDILIRNLLDLPPTSPLNSASRIDSLRHTYLRVLHPLLTNTQLRLPPHYKQDELRRTLHILAKVGTHFDSPDETTLRLVGRCLTVDWLRDPDEQLPPSAETAVAVADADAADPNPPPPDAAVLPAEDSIDTEAAIDAEATSPTSPASEPAAPTTPRVELTEPEPEAMPSTPNTPSPDIDTDPERPSTSSPGSASPTHPHPPVHPPRTSSANGHTHSKPAVPAPRLARRKQHQNQQAGHLGTLQPASAQMSASSVVEMASAQEKPGVMTPSRAAVENAAALAASAGGGSSPGLGEKAPPPRPPPTRGSWRRARQSGEGKREGDEGV